MKTIQNLWHGVFLQIVMLGRKMCPSRVSSCGSIFRQPRIWIAFMGFRIGKMPNPRRFVSESKLESSWKKHRVDAIGSCNQEFRTIWPQSWLFGRFTKRTPALNKSKRSRYEPKKFILKNALPAVAFLFGWLWGPKVFLYARSTHLLRDISLRMCVNKHIHIRCSGT